MITKRLNSLCDHMFTVIICSHWFSWVVIIFVFRYVLTNKLAQVRRNFINNQNEEYEIEENNSFVHEDSPNNTEIDEISKTATNLSSLTSVISGIPSPNGCLSALLASISVSMIHNIHVN